MDVIYLDHAATTPIDPAVVTVMAPFWSERSGNPSSVHAAGRAARSAIDSARDALADVLRCAARELVFTGSGTEADNLALRGALERWGNERGRHIVVSALEHDAVLDTARHLAGIGAADITVVGCDHDGRVDPEAVAAAVRSDTVLVSVMLVNNETGVEQDVAAIAQAVHRHNSTTLVHTDAVQALPRLAVDPAALGVDLLSMSAHKLYGPKGVGALWVRHGTHIAAQMTGGGQERNRRSGTENTPGIVGFATAARRAADRREREGTRQTQLCRLLMERVNDSVSGVHVTGSDEHRAPGFATFPFDAVRSDVLLTVLDSHGVLASAGSACSSGAPMPSHVLTAMGYAPDLAAGALRCTTGVSTTVADIERAVDLIAAAVAQVRESRPVAGSTI
ncbi:MAG: cysteine desulfurase family protein [Candidatus Dormibacteria bacterium]